AAPQALQRSVLDASHRTAAALQESVAALDTVRVFAAQDEEEERHRRELAEELRLNRQMELELAGFTLVQRLLELSVRVLVLLRSLQQLRDGSITPGVLVTFLLYQDTIGHHTQVIPVHPSFCPCQCPSIHPASQPSLCPCVHPCVHPS
ncbi:TAP2 protein, partial [Sapayoa aenigma]|nr:TAP2 protein [Sapayoa aenigma]